MTTQDRSTPPQQQYADRSYRSPAALAGGVLLLALGGWLGGDALLQGVAHTKLMAVFALLLGVPLVIAYTLRPLVRAGADRLTVRNPFRTVTLPWGAVETLRAAFSTEVVSSDGTTYQLWAIPVSLRQRKKASRQARRGAGSGPRFGPHAGAGEDDSVQRAVADQALVELREVKERAADREGAQGEPVVRWSYETLAPMVVGAVGLIVMAVL
ncbi:PH domain-containing protein [Streptomyces angustmyceticus]|uniref:Membrane protein n=1 Tax=Streptomyces angustmyceticus TaxID=285578 RepID=A0A5J4LI14_9ACTN|nr:PH domain-containing protein [Streptomyces angustmyceticus]UAL67451.1 PH domain-containing protein [Streptomyces angustmyceticus]GES31189.1 membrane protein [Streptomyces angustmyceticus]